MGLFLSKKKNSVYPLSLVNDASSKCEESEEELDLIYKKISKQSDQNPTKKS